MKTKFVLVTDPKEIERLTGKGKYRETLPFWVRVGEALWLERKETPVSLREQACTNLSQS